MAELTSELLFEMTVEFGEEMQRFEVGDGGGGVRLIVPAVGDAFKGPHLRGEVVPPWPDYILTRPDGVNEHDMHATLRTDDGALIYMQYRALSHRQSLGPLSDDQPYAYFRTQVRFETGAEQYQWLNRIFAVGVAAPHDGAMGWSVYAVK
jgi:hypothetical protein